MQTPDSRPDSPLRIAWLVYRGNPHCGGQGVYTMYLARELTELGHTVEVFSGQPYPELADMSQLTKVPSLDRFGGKTPFFPPAPWKLKDTIDLREVLGMSRGGFPEPYTFSLRARRLLQTRRADFDLVHDNQCLGSGLLPMMHDDGWPVLCTLHHPITVDRDVDLAHATSAYRRWVFKRWYRFLDMQMRVAREMPRVVTVSESSKRDIVAQMGVKPERLHIVPVGVDPVMFRPMPEIARVPGRIMTTTSSDVPMKGLAVLLEALAKLRTERPDAELVCIGAPKKNSTIPPIIERLGLEGAVR
ncbi:MAG: glycosyltransferase family 4 protein, partial [Acidimicrobiia bacterium]